MAPDLPSVLAQAVAHHQAGRLGEAIAGYRQALAIKPGLARVLYNLGSALCEQGKLDEAEASLRQALALQPGFANAHNNLGIVLYEQGKPGEAVDCYRRALAQQPAYAEALNNLGAALCRQGAFDEGEACIRRALHLKPDFAGAYDNLGTVLWEQGKREEAEASVRQALARAPNLVRALGNLAGMLKDQGRLNEAVAAYRQLVQIAPENNEGLIGLAYALAMQGDAKGALKTILQSLRIKETSNAKRVFVSIVKQPGWTDENGEVRRLMTRAIHEPWVRPNELAHSSANLIKQAAQTGACVARAVRAWPQSLPASELFGPDGAGALAADELLLALLVSAQNTDIELERFLTLARRALLEAAMDDDAGETGLEFYAALARQCFINEYVFFHGEEEIRQANALRDGLAAALDAETPISPLRLLTVAVYFPLRSLSGAAGLLERAWPSEIAAVLAQQVREPREEAQLRTSIPRLTQVADTVSRLVQSQYEENPYPRWVRMPPVEKADSIEHYLRGKFPLAAIERGSARERADFLSAGCGTGQLALEIAQGVAARVLAIDLSLASLGYAKRKAQELDLLDIEFAQADLLELGTIDRRFDVVECSGVLHHMRDPFAGWRALLSLLNPGGFMLVGLYSEAARHGVVEARRFIAERGYGTSADDIRRCRQDLLALDGKPGADFGDFFGVSSCRDLLFHVQEHRTSLSAIGAFLKNNGLTFLGFEIGAATMQAYKQRFPGNPATANLNNWEVFERDHPDTFSNMYVFWIQKHGAA
ncbi:MAG TPA: tetratricopeptide repeat protein [Rhizomicrobium sp.]|nr:tetratricopeptide repeat protein [Rhizomicrobium sp.]